MAAVKELLRAENDGSLSETTLFRKKRRKIIMNLKVIFIK